MAPSIPDRWIPYKACGDIIEGTRIICFKVPLRRRVQAKFASKDIWDIKALLKKIPKLRAVIDLTNTARYYDAHELKSAGILHTKILMPGRIIPPEDKVTQFMNAVDKSLKVDKDSLVGVHCTHGLNRTGYMVCRYMRDRLGIPAKEAIKRFETARGYKIERENYIADLLGKPPPPPDVGRDTVVKPIFNRNIHTSYYFSPLNDYNDEAEHQRESSKRRFGNQSSYRNDRNYNTNRREEPSIKRLKNNRQSDSSSKMSTYQYDYTYDY
ncbi:RNA/RNP complex-1-interacting phosphatase [Maniola hyperantus]|uniref:RNA/RNP complex-1-interacting phosphatase n=1 Tax=Aphantopus hyperantus TaxID=2795564 RepID=UPI00156913FB|nr:RNA/RNP complex-1-interacting phosphatase [Maniola hyperantus]